MTILKPLDSPERSSGMVSFLHSSVGRKVLTGLTGLGMVTFVVIHMLGNLLLLVSRDRFNQYAYVLDQLKPLVVLIEVGLIALVIIHAVLGIQIFWRKHAARPQSYETYQSAGAPSHQTWSSRQMIWTGVGLGGFLIWHLLTFKFGVVYRTTLGGIPVRDLAQLVIESFRRPWFTVSYSVILGGLFLHLRHGLWSALQSIGVLFPDRVPGMYWVCNAIAAILVIGFLLPPSAICLGWVR